MSKICDSFFNYKKTNKIDLFENRFSLKFAVFLNIKESNKHFEKLLFRPYLIYATRKVYAALVFMMVMS